MFFALPVLTYVMHGDLSKCRNCRIKLLLTYSTRVLAGFIIPYTSGEKQIPSS